MFDRFTDGARNAMGFARQASLRWGHDSIAPEHMLLGLLEAGEGVALDVLHGIGADPGEIRGAVEQRLPPGEASGMLGQIPFTKQTKRTLELALETASRFGHDSIGTEHVLLALAASSDAAVHDVLERLRLDFTRLREVLERRLARGESKSKTSQLPFTPAAKQALEAALETMRELGHDRVGPAHVLAGLARGPDDIAAQVLRELGVTLEAAKAVAEASPS